jgi:hypothetical protein
MKFSDFIDYILLYTSIVVAWTAVVGMSMLIYIVFLDRNPLHKPQHIFIHAIDMIPRSKNILVDDEGEWTFTR